MPTRPAALIAVLAASLAAVGCGEDERETLPAECTSGPGQVRAALAKAPAPVTLAGTPLSECFIRDADAADVQLVGATFLAAAAPLAERAKRDPEGGDAVRLGYLVGAVRRGVERKQGIYAEAVRRLNQELAGVDRQTSAFRRGQRAGLASG